MSEQLGPKAENQELNHLELNKESVRELTEREAEQVEGGLIMQDTKFVRTGTR